MSHPSKQKGNGFEREIVKLAEQAGLDAKRAWGSNGLSLGFTEDVDCIVAGLRVQAKRRKKLADYLKPSINVDVQVFREDRGEPLALLRYTDLLEILAGRHK